MVLIYIPHICSNTIYLKDICIKYIIDLEMELTVTLDFINLGKPMTIIHRQTDICNTHTHAHTHTYTHTHTHTHTHAHKHTH